MEDVHLICSAAKVEIYQGVISSSCGKRMGDTREVITMVIARLHPNMHLIRTISRLLDSLLEGFRPQLPSLIELVLLPLERASTFKYTTMQIYSTYDIDKHVQSCPLRHFPNQARRIPLFALLRAVLQVSIECLDAPLPVGRVKRRCKCRGGLVCARCDGAEVERNCAVATHRVPEDALPGKIQWEPVESPEEGG